MSVALPIPEPRTEDDEDVHWALSTASALWARGEPQEALKWLRRAAETASDANRDDRSLELFKAAADFANGLQKRPESVAPPAPTASRSVPPPQPHASTPPPPAVAMRAASSPPPAGQQPSSPPPHPSRSNGPPPLVRQAAHQAPPTTQLHPQAQHPQFPPPPPPQQHQHHQQHAPQQVQPPAARVHAPPVKQTMAMAQQPAPSRQLPPPEWAPPLSTSPGPFQPQPRHAPASEAFAPTVPHPTVPHPNVGGAPWLQAEQSTARVPITDVDAALRKMEPAPAKKTLASNVHFNEVMEDQASLRKTARSSKPVAVSNDRATDPGVGPALEQAQPKAKRRATQSGRKSTAKIQVDPSDVAATRVVAPFQPIPGIPAGNVAILELDSREAEPPSGHRFEDEGTLEQHATLVGVSYDLDEQTNVLSGLESNIVLQANTAEKTEAEHAQPPSDANERRDELAALETTPTSELARERPATERPPSEALRSLAAYRIALGRTSNGGLEVKLLAPGEPTPAGRVGAILVPTDAISSSSLFDLLTAKPR